MPKLVDLVYNLAFSIRVSYVNCLFQVTHIDITDNPWHCDCKLKWLKELQEKTASRYVFDLTIRCASPPRMKGKEWYDIKAADFVCKVS